jgi:hypothetical protein
VKPLLQPCLYAVKRKIKVRDYLKYFIQVPEKNRSGKYLFYVVAQILYLGRLGKSGTQVIAWVIGIWHPTLSRIRTFQK